MIANRMSVALTLFLAAGVLLCARDSVAHDLEGLAGENSTLDSFALAKIAEFDKLRTRLAQLSAKNGGQNEAVVAQAFVWPQNQPVHVCFFGGSQLVRDHIAVVATQWLDGTSLVLDFGNPGARRSCDGKQPTDIRVSFGPGGNWSAVGTSARFEKDPTKQTLNLEGMDRLTSFIDNNDGTILHEFGHAIGFEHEHQGQSGKCQTQFNMTWLYDYLGKFGWTKQKVNDNMLQFNQDSRKQWGIFETAFDRQSVMLYSLNRKAFNDPDDPVKGSCYIATPNNTLSALDRAAAKNFYPPAGQGGAAGIPGGAEMDREMQSDLHTVDEMLNHP
jgi:hypothetical protein